MVNDLMGLLLHSIGIGSQQTGWFNNKDRNYMTFTIIMYTKHNTAERVDPRQLKGICDLTS